MRATPAPSVRRLGRRVSSSSDLEPSCQRWYRVRFRLLLALASCGVLLAGALPAARAQSNTVGSYFAVTVTADGQAAGSASVSPAMGAGSAWSKFNNATVPVAAAASGTAETYAATGSPSTGSVTAASTGNASGAHVILTATWVPKVNTNEPPPAYACILYKRTLTAYATCSATAAAGGPLTSNAAASITVGDKTLNAGGVSASDQVPPPAPSRRLP